MEGIWHLYVVRTVDDSLYAGITTDVQRRFREHAAQGPRTAGYLRAHKAQALAFSIPVGGKALALKVEYHFKRLAKRDKERIVREKHLGYDKGSGRILR
jgi:putative endonuclease